jgi:hypothetical protein
LTFASTILVSSRAGILNRVTSFVAAFASPV